MFLPVFFNLNKYSSTSFYKFSAPIFTNPYSPHNSVSYIKCPTLIFLISQRDKGPKMHVPPYCPDAGVDKNPCT